VQAEARNKREVAQRSALENRLALKEELLQLLKGDDAGNHCLLACGAGDYLALSLILHVAK
jgi:hypothetical protein